MRIFLSFFLSVISFTAFATDYYWVGGTGKWSEYNLHWAKSSGSSTFHNQVPTHLDNVYFDANSGFTNSSNQVLVDQTIVYCKDMDWTGASNTPMFISSGTNILKTYGSLKLIPAMSFNFAGTMSFESTVTGKTITTANKQILTSDFVGMGGEWILQDSLKSFTLNLIAGTLNAGNHVVYAPFFFSSNTNTRSLILGNKDFLTSRWETQTNTNFTLNAGTSHIKFTPYNSNSFEMRTGYEPLNFYNVSASSSVINFTLSGNNNNYHKLALDANSSISLGVSATCDSLVLFPGRTYKAINTIRINFGGRLVAEGTCGNPISIYGSNPQYIFTIDVSTSGASSYTFNYLYLSNTTLTKGSLNVTSNNSLELENAIGWNINPPTSRNLYWVGGAGQWNQKNHWSATSSGTGGECIPGPIDNVFFDANSGFTSMNNSVSASSEIFCKNMNWSGAPSAPQFSGTSMRIFGSLTFSPSMTAYLNGYVYFNSSSLGNTITMNGKSFSNEVFFEGTGEWILQDEFKTVLTLSLNKGTFRTNNKPMTIGAFKSSAGSLYLGSSIVTIKCTYGEMWRSTSPFILDAGTSTILVKELAGVHSLYTANTYNGVGVSFYNFIVEDSPLALKIQYGSNTFHKLHMKSNGFFETPNSYDSLVLEGNHTYSIHFTQTINPGGDFVAKGSCSKRVTLLGDVTKYSYISKASGTIALDYVIMNDLNSAGGAVFTANNSIDNGGNTGWIINVPASRDLYWVGGSGSWFDDAHWALTSGGAGGNCIPYISDNVYFNGGSGFTSNSKTVTLIAGTGYCKNMDWTGATTTPTFTVNQLLKVFGSLTLNPNMNFSSTGSVISFESDQTGNTIKSYGKTFSDIIFNNPKGEWTLSDAVSVSNIISVKDGKFMTNGKEVSAKSFRLLDIGTDTVSVELGSSKLLLRESFIVSYGEDVLHFDAGTSEIIISNSNNSSGQEVFIGASQSDSDQMLKFHKVTIQKGLAECLIFGINTFHELTLGSNTYFYNFLKVDHLALTQGKTYTFQKSVYFSPEGSLSAIGKPDFPIEIISATDGSQIQFNKESGILCGEYLYLKDIAATGGASWYAGVHGADVSNNAGWLFEPCTLTETNNTISEYEFSIVPNPTNGPVSVSFKAQEAYDSEIILREVTGREVKRFKNKVITGDNEFALDLSGLGKGMYYLEITVAGRSSMQRVVVY